MIYIIECFGKIGTLCIRHSDTSPEVFSLYVVMILGNFSRVETKIKKLFIVYIGNQKVFVLLFKQIH